MPTLAVSPDDRQRLLIFNLRTDADDHILGFTTRWINAIAPYYDAVDVLTMHKGRLDVANNVRVFSAGREQGYSKPRRVAEFYRQLSGLLLRHRYNACFAHMMPLFAAMGAPLLTASNVPTTTWYTHREYNQQVAWAERLSYRIVSAVPSSFPIPTPKLRPIGHGINTDFYAPDDTAPINAIPAASRPRVVQVARLTSIKHQHILLQAAQPLDCEIVFVGDIPDGYDDAYKQRLQRQVEELEMQQRVIFAGAQTPEQVRDWYRSAALAVNLSPPGLFDKAALEAMACAVPTIVSNEAFASLTGSHHDRLHIDAPDNVTQLRDTLRVLLTLSESDRDHIGADLRAQTVEQHSLSALVVKLINVMHTGDITGT